MATRFIHEKLSLLQSSRDKDIKLLNKSSSEIFGKLIKRYPQAISNLRWEERVSHEGSWIARATLPPAINTLPDIDFDIQPILINGVWRRVDLQLSPTIAAVEAMNRQAVKEYDQKYKNLRKEPKDWLPRLAMIANAASTPSPRPPLEPLLWAKPWETRLSPLSDEGFKKYNEKVLLGISTAVCPKLVNQRQKLTGVIFQDALIE